MFYHDMFYFLFSLNVLVHRSYNTFQRNPLVTKLVPAIGIVIFVLWGLQPLMQLSRKIFLEVEDLTRDSQSYTLIWFKRL
ncbi:hypothetical protein RND81_09G084200 [Saponaria officinalis]|uniref:Uncharacterized protein n=1 Tax=Saponaria officinalis TaxID=3572 RepID=A0AAW1IJA8_SAPOF